ncbi:hypothetical protein NDU88_004018 [Pleurodeles waltl]|uniref:Uncharacterized protein n=1 Tax=Pleurodeles waltl TaxID=8319 RepID=A0AAV7T6W7_PLEWA|nr:hypothetical protein NDU88_004018 [Pleurodeles waltl]
MWWRHWDPCRDKGAGVYSCVDFVVASSLEYKMFTVGMCKNAGKLILHGARGTYGARGKVPVGEPYSPMEARGVPEGTSTLLKISIMACKKEDGSVPELGTPAMSELVLTLIMEAEYTEVEMVLEELAMGGGKSPQAQALGRMEPEMN